MECQKVRDRFSSYLEKELTPSEEKEIRDHLQSCPKCRKEFEKFEKTMQWLHSVKEVEVPDAFASELYQKMEDRKKRTSAERSMRWLGIPLPFKLPVQAVAMVTVVFLVLYLVKMMPRSPSPLPVEKKPTLSLPSDSSTTHSTERPSDSAHGPEISEQAAKSSAEQPSASQPPRHEKSRGAGRRVEGLEKFQATASQRKTEPKKAEGPAPQTETMAFRQTEPKEAEGAKAASSGSEQFGGKSVSKKKAFSAAQPLQEIVLRVSNQEKAVSQICELVERYKGKMITKEGNGLLASLPASSFSDFEKKLTALKVSEERFVSKSDTRDRIAEPRVEKGAVEGKRESVTLETDEEDRIVIRILLVQE